MTPDSAEGKKRMLKKAQVHLAVLAVIVTVAVPAGVLSADASTAGYASTAACGSSCTSPWVESDGSGEVLAVSGSGVVMAASSTSNSAEDWTVEQEGTIGAANSWGIVSSKLMLLYQDSVIVEFQYAPNGSPTDRCLGDLAAVNSSETFYNPTVNVGLVTCGTTPASLWAIDQNNENDGLDDLINVGYEGGYTYLAPYNPSADQDPVTTPFAEPDVLTFISGGTVELAPLSEIGGVVSPTQLWSDWSSPSQSALRKAVVKSR
jgi:hypothetical protein